QSHIHPTTLLLTVLLRETSKGNGARAEGVYLGTLPLDRVEVLAGNPVKEVLLKIEPTWSQDQTTALQPHSSGVKIQDLMFDHQDKCMMKAQVHVSKSSAFSDIQALPQRKYFYYQVVIREESSKNLAKLLYSSMSTRTKLGLGFKVYIGSDEVCDLSTPNVFDPDPENREVESLYEKFVKAGSMHEVPPPIIGTFMPTSYKSDLEETQPIFGSKSNTSSINTFDSNDCVFCDNSDKSLTSKTNSFASCVLSPKTNDSFSTVDVKILPKSDVKDPSPTNGFPSCFIKENVKPLRNLWIAKVAIGWFLRCEVGLDYSKVGKTVNSGGALFTGGKMETR
nr:hypothetical protein [Tanacetum cinerariifolium]